MRNGLWFLLAVICASGEVVAWAAPIQFRLSYLAWTELDRSDESAVIGVDFPVLDRFSLGPEIGTWGRPSVGLRAHFHATGSAESNSVMLGAEVLKTFEPEILLRATAGYRWVFSNGLSASIDGGVASDRKIWPFLTLGASIGMRL